MPSPTALIYAYLNHNLICLHLPTGEEVWRTKLPKSGSYVASLLVQDDAVIVGVNGVIHCVDAYARQLRWTNELKGLGLRKHVPQLHYSTSRRDPQRIKSRRDYRFAVCRHPSRNQRRDTS